MQFTVERRYKQNNNDSGITFIARYWLTLSEPKPLSVNYLFNAKLSELAIKWYMLETEHPQRTDINAQMLERVPGWNDATLKSLTAGAEFSAGDPITLAAVEEGVRRALAVLPIVDRYADAFARPSERTFDMANPDAAPTGSWAVKA